jgi:hypothetical protein
LEISMDGPRSKPTDQLSWVSVHGEIREVRRIVRNVRDMQQETEFVSESEQDQEEKTPPPELVPMRAELAPLFRGTAAAGGGSRRPPDEPTQTLKFPSPPGPPARTPPFPPGRTVQGRATVRGSRTQIQPMPERLQLELPHRIKPEPRAEKPARKGGPILPFFGVLLRGVDAPLLSRQPPDYHPSVGYAREVYVAILMNWFVDLFGFTYLFHSYLASWEPAWLPWTLGLVLGVAFSTAFGTFALSLVRKPLSAPTFGRKEHRIAGILMAAGGAGLVVGAIFGEGEVSKLFELAKTASWIAFAGGAALGLLTTFGFQDGATVFTRATVMMGVAYLVAGPLHEAMFRKEILQSFRERSLQSLEREIASTGPALEAAKATVLSACMRARKIAVNSQNGEGGCEEVKRERGRAELLVQAIDFVKDQELTGVDASVNRTFLVDSAMKLDATAVVALLGTGASGQAGEGRRYQQAVAMESEARRAAEQARETETSCVTALGECEQAVVSDPNVLGLSQRLGELGNQADVLRRGVEEPGAIERALALEAILVGEGGPDSGRRAEILSGKLLAAWFLAMVMPIIVLVMKISAGDKLEPYLRKRWAMR